MTGRERSLRRDTMKTEKRNKKYRINGILLLSTLITVAVFSCNKPSEYSGTITGLWRCAELGKQGARTYNIDIASTANDSTVYKFYNFHNAGFESWIYAKLSPSNILTIESQFLGSSTTSVIGTGSYNQATEIIELSYVINEGYADIEISGTLTRL